MDRHAMARAARRRQAEDALAVERDREQMLVEQLEEVIAETDAGLVDDAVFANMDAADVELVRAVLGTDVADVDNEFEGFAFEEDAAALQEEELERLGRVIDECRRTQRALESYLRALDGPS